MHGVQLSVSLNSDININMYGCLNNQLTTPPGKKYAYTLTQTKRNPRWKTLDSWAKLIGSTIFEQCGRPHLPILKLILAEYNLTVSLLNHQATKFSGCTVRLDVHPLCRSASTCMYTPVFKSVVGMRLNETTHAQSDWPSLAYLLDKVFFAILGVEKKGWILLCVLNDVCIDSYRKFECSGVARTSLLLGHSMGTLHSYELPHEVQKLMGGLGASSPWKFYSVSGWFWGHVP